MQITGRACRVVDSPLRTFEFAELRTDDGRMTTPHGALIEEARERLSLSKRKAATLAGISEGRWRQITSGVQRAGGIDIPVNPKPETLAAMARAVGLLPAQVLVAAGMEPTFEAADLEVPGAASDLTGMLARIEDLERRMRHLEQAQQPSLARDDIDRTVSTQAVMDGTRFGRSGRTYAQMETKAARAGRPSHGEAGDMSAVGEESQDMAGDEPA